MQDSFTPAVEGAKGFAGWLSGVLGTGQGHAETLLVAVGISGAAATVVAWMLVGFTTIALTLKFRAVVFWGFAFVVAFVVVTGMGVSFR